MAFRLKNVIIAGGKGFVGRALEGAFRSAGARVNLITRNPISKDDIGWDELKDIGLPERTDILVNVCGENILNKTRRWSDRLREDIFNSRVQTTSVLIDAIQKSDQKPHVYLGISGISAYQETCPTLVHDENSNELATHLWAQLCLQLEQTALNGLAGQDTRCTIIRSGVVLGKEGGMIRELWLPFKFGLGARLGSGMQPFPWIHVHDLTNLFLFCAQNPNLTGIVNGVAPQRTTNAEFTRAFASALNRPGFLALPEWLVKMIYGQERSDLVLKAPYVQPKRALDNGFKFNFPNIESACLNLAS